jgi:DNA-binding NarL/FixJ family response regulator
MLRETWTALLNNVPGLEVSGCAGSGTESIELALALKPDIVLMDLHMLPMSGFEAAEKIHHDVPECKIVGLSMSMKPEHVRRLFAIGGVAYLTKNCTFDEVVYGIREVVKGNKYVCRDIKDILADRMIHNNDDARQKLQLLTKKEIEVINLVREGFSSKEIAARIDLSVKTVEVHRYNVLKKLEIRNRAQLVMFMNEQGM